jgi:arabinofuranan 3-O-arabinosyltransferase
MGLMRTPAVPTIVITVARSFVAAALFGYFFDLLHQTHNHLLNADGRPFGDDWVNYWSGGYLALHGRAAEVYDLNAFHAFQQTIVGSPLDGYHYSYPPVMLLLSAPFALIPYVPALFVWLSASWYAFYRTLRLAMPGRSVLLLALSAPVVLINAVGGQNGCWTAALLGGGLSLLERRPYIAGALFGAMIYKPHLALLVPFALLAGRQWRAIAAAAVAAGLLLGLSLLVFGLEVWAHYLRNLTALRHVILEEGVSPRMVSVFVLARTLGASIDASYWVQGGFGLIACLAVAWAWFKDMPAGVKNALVLLGTALTAPYLQDYDLVFCVIAVAWLWQQPVESARSERALLIASGLLLIVPLVAAALFHLSGEIAFGALFVLPAFAVALHMAFGAQPAILTPAAVSRTP